MHFSTYLTSVTQPVYYRPTTYKNKCSLLVSIFYRIIDFDLDEKIDHGKKKYKTIYILYITTVKPITEAPRVCIVVHDFKLKKQLTHALYIKLLVLCMEPSTFLSSLHPHDSEVL